MGALITDRIAPTLDKVMKPSQYINQITPNEIDRFKE